MESEEETALAGDAKAPDYEVSGIADATEDHAVSRKQSMENGEGHSSPLARKAVQVTDTADEEYMENVVAGGSLIPPINFGIVEENLYRSGLPNELNFPFLEKLQLKTIINLASEDLTHQFSNFVDDQSIELVPLGGTGLSISWKPMSEEVVLTALDHILNTVNYPLLIMCHFGRHQTGTIVGCMRKLQRWNLTAVFEEYRSFAGNKVRLLSEQFIELFDTDLVRIPPNPPRWL